MSQMRQAAYVESWDMLEFPSIDARSSSVAIPLFHQTVALVRGIAAEGTPDAGEEVWLVTGGHPLVAKSMAECGGGDQDRMSDIKRWIASARKEAQEGKSAERGWRRGREKELTAHPLLAAALTLSPETLYDRAKLSDPQRSAMRVFCQTDDEGDFKGYSQIGKELGISKESARDRIEGALKLILAIEHTDVD